MQLDPSLQLVYPKRGEVYLRLGIPERALADYKQAAKQNPFCALACLKRSEAY